MNSETIGFVGDGWGALAAIKSLKKLFIIHYMSNDKDVINEISSEKGSCRIKQLIDFNVKIVVFAGKNHIIPKEFILNHTAINVHYSLLPKYRGLHSVAWAIINGEKRLGLSVHLMTEFIDDGPVIFQKAFVNDNKLTATNYIVLMNKFIEQNLGEIVMKYINNQLAAIPQNKKVASWVSKRGAKHNFIDFNQSYVHIERLFRVLNPPYPYPKISYNGKIYSIKKINFHNSDTISDISRILNIDEDGVWVKNLDGYIILKHIVDQNNTDIDYSSFKIGQYLND